MKDKKPILTLTKADFKVETFRAGGPGGQYQNVTESAVRITHSESGISHESRVHRCQHANKKEAFRKFSKDPKFILWLNRKLMNIEDIEHEVDEMMEEKNIKTEIQKDGRWVEVNELEN